MSEIGGISSMAAGLAQSNTATAVGLSVFKSAVNMQAQAVQTLLQALPPPGTTVNPPNLGNVIDVQA